MGTALRRRGLSAERFPEEWIRERPQEIEAVHAEHVRAGAQVLLTCTFNAARLEAREIGDDVESLCRRAVALARSPGPTLVAGCVGATGLVRGDGAGPDDGELRDRFERPFRALAAAGVDLLWTETHVALREARAALAAARRAGRPAAATMHFRAGPGGMEALDGTPAEECLAALWRDRACAVGANCADPGAPLAALAARGVARAGVPVIVKPSAGTPARPLPPEAFAAATWPAIRAGARLFGGCCGAGPAHLRALAAAARRA